MTNKPTRPKSTPDRPSPYLKGGEFKRAADEINKRASPPPSQRENDGADLPAKDQEKRQRG